MHIFHLCQARREPTGSFQVVHDVMALTRTYVSHWRTQNIVAIVTDRITVLCIDDE